MLRTFVLLLVLFLVRAAAVPGQETDPSASAPSMIVVTGTASETVPPDGVSIRLLVSNLADSPRQAAERTAEDADEVRRALEGLGIADLRVTRVGYGLVPDWRYTPEREREFRGYAARVTIQVDTGALEEAGRIVEAGVSSGATEVHGVEFTSSEIAEARRDALRGAIEAARLDASAMAEAAGGSLGRLLLLTTERLDPSPGIQVRGGSLLTTRGFGTGTSVTELTPQDLTVTARVEGRWELAAEPE